MTEVAIVGIGIHPFGRTDGVYELSITYLAGCLICRDPARLERRK